MSRLITRYRSQKENPFLRPQFIIKDKEFNGYYISLINQKIAGIKINNHLYGWLPYFQEMTDLHLLYEMDFVLHKKFLKDLEIEKYIKYLPEVYWDIKKHAGKNTLVNFDAITEVGDMRIYLLKNGLIDEDKQYSDDYIKKRYYIHLEHLKKDVRMSVGTTY